ncbi:APC membrane recruitment protein 1-like [Megalops cyprinoides]|uniref:APC membrane recruitment protein 1-like n=1 Tax=Megalops cyprinoides TaxID=118141 RepID=UPI001863CF5D|nr:APC membrane recruitment protein 1-like [Megalops cyprinoides]
MEASKGGKMMGEGRPLTGGCEENSVGQHSEPMIPPLHTSCDTSPPELQSARTLKRTALKLFVGRTLPSFFGSRKKNNEKGLKKWISKSKTHDGISKVSWEEGRRVGDVPTSDFEYHSHKDKVLVSCQSSHAMNEILEGGVSSRLPSLGGDHKPFWEKSFNFPRPKRGFKGLFSSLRCSRKDRDADSVKHESFELSGDIHEDVVPAAECRIDPHDRNASGSLSEPKVPVLNVRDSLATCEVTQEAIVCEKGLPINAQESVKLLMEDQILAGGSATVEVIADVQNFDEKLPHTNRDLSQVSMVNLEYAGREQPSIQTPDQISVISGDTSSLKSFGSLTGCGDVIADQNEDSFADKSVLEEKNPSNGKRSSCYVNYQGGGEEMAVPDEGDKDYLGGLWESKAVVDIDRFPRGQQGLVPCKHIISTGLTSEVPSVPSPHLDTAGSSSLLQADTGTFLVPGDVLTPQSDQQGSVPNSDEGYFDSITPGPDDEGGDDSDRIGSERLPRDTYSGDALYELYEPEHSLTTTPLESKSSLVSPFPPPEFLPLMLQSCDTKSSHSLIHESGLTGPEEGRLTKTRQCCGWQDTQMVTAEEHVIFDKGRFCSEKITKECMPRVNKKQACLKEGHQVSWTTNPKVENILYGSSKFTARNKNGQCVPCIPKVSDIDPLNITVEDVAFSASLTKTSHPMEDLTPHLEQDYQRDLSENQKMQSSNRVEEGAEHGQAVCFSQALVDFTKRSELLNNISQSFMGPEPSDFAENVHALPSMVTFDVFDMENEGECDSQIEMELEMEVMDEDAESPYDMSAYESYLQKDAFAECDDRTLNDFDQSLFISNTFGVASLPRYFGLAGIDPPVPALLTLKRRSRSLDTDALELELRGMCLTQRQARPLLTPLPRSEHFSGTTASLHLRMNGPFASSETEVGADKSWQPETSGGSVPSLIGKKEVQVQGALDRERATPACSEMKKLQPTGQATKCKIRPQISKCAVQDTWCCNSMLLNSGQMARSSHLPVPCRHRLSPPDPDLSGILGEHTCKELFQVTALDNRNQENLSKKSFAKQPHDSPLQHPKVRPVGVTRGMPHFQSDANETSNPAVFKELRELTSKGRKELGVPLHVGCHKRNV